MIPLPTPEKKGIGFHVTNMGRDSFEIEIYRPSGGTNVENYYLLIFHKEIPIFVAKVQLISPVTPFKVHFPTQHYPAGGVFILNLMRNYAMLGSRRDNILGERLIFIKPQTTLQVNLQMDKPNKTYAVGIRFPF